MKGTRPLTIILAVVSFCKSSGAETPDALKDPPTTAKPLAQFNKAVSGLDTSDFVTSRSTIGRFASTKAGDHEDAGYLTNGGGQYGGVLASHVVYTSDEISLQRPPGAAGIQTLYAPTTRPPNGSCLEIGTAYTTDSSRVTRPSVYVFDFCGGMRFKKNIPVDKEFVAKYTNLVDGLKFYTLAITTNASQTNKAANWNAALWNFQSHDWDPMYSTTGSFNDTRGWSIFETWYKKGQCSPSLPRLSASDIYYKDLKANRWEIVRPNMEGLTVLQHDGRSSNATNTNCFNDDDTGKASYVFRVDKADSDWTVQSTGK